MIRQRPHGNVPPFDGIGPITLRILELGDVLHDRSLHVNFVPLQGRQGRHHLRDTANTVDGVLIDAISADTRCDGRRVVPAKELGILVYGLDTNGDTAGVEVGSDAVKHRSESLDSCLNGLMVARRKGRRENSAEGRA